jgi:hypothetical protein
MVSPGGPNQGPAATLGQGAAGRRGPRNGTHCYPAREGLFLVSWGRGRKAAVFCGESPRGSRAQALIAGVCWGQRCEGSAAEHRSVMTCPGKRRRVEESPGRHAQERWRCGGEPSKGGHWPSSRVSSGTVQQPPGWLRKGRQGALCSALVFKGPARIATERQPCQARDRDVVPHRGMARSGSFAKDGRGQRCGGNAWSGSLVQECKGEACRRSRSVGEAV